MASPRHERDDCGCTIYSATQLTAHPCALHAQTMTHESRLAMLLLLNREISRLREDFRDHRNEPGPRTA